MSSISQKKKKMKDDLHLQKIKIEDDFELLKTKKILISSKRKKTMMT